MTAPVRPLSPEEFRRQRLSPETFRRVRRDRRAVAIKPDASFVNEPTAPHGPLHEMRMASAEAPALSAPTRQTVEHERRARGRSGAGNLARGILKRGAETIPATMEGFARLIGDETGAERFAMSRERMRVLDPQGRAGETGEFIGAVLGEGALAGAVGSTVAPRLISRARTPLGRAAATIAPTVPTDAAIGAANPRPGTSPLQGALENVGLNAVLPTAVEGSSALLRRVRRRPRATGAPTSQASGIEPQEPVAQAAAPVVAEPVADMEPFTTPVPDSYRRGTVPESIDPFQRAVLKEKDAMRKRKRKAKDLSGEADDAIVSRLLSVSARLEKNQRAYGEGMYEGYWANPHINRDMEIVAELQDELARRGVDVDEAIERIAERDGLAMDAPVEYAEEIDMGTPFGHADLRAVSAVAGTGVGAATGAALDDENRLRGAALGAGLGGTIGALSPSAFRSGRAGAGRESRMSLGDFERRATESLVDILPEQRGITGNRPHPSPRIGAVGDIGKMKQGPQRLYRVEGEQRRPRRGVLGAGRYVTDNENVALVYSDGGDGTLFEYEYARPPKLLHQDDPVFRRVRQEADDAFDWAANPTDTRGLEDDIRRRVLDLGYDGVQGRDGLDGIAIFNEDILREVGRVPVKGGYAQRPSPSRLKNRPGKLDLFGNNTPDPSDQTALFAGKEGTEASRGLAGSERAAKGELDKLLKQRDMMKGMAPPALNARIAELQRLVNRGEKIGQKELEIRADAGEGDLFGGMKNRPGFVSLSPKKPVPQPYMADPAVQSIRSTIRGGGPSSSPRSSISEMAHKAYTRLVDELHPLREFGRKVGKSERLSHEVSRALGWQGAAEARLYEGLRPVLRVARGHEDGVMALAKAERIIELADAGKATDPKQLADATATVMKLGQVPEVRQAVDQLRAYYRSLLDHKLANNVISKEQYDKIVASGQAYVPLLPSEIAEARAPGAGGGKLANRGTGVRRMSDNLNRADTVDPFEQAVLDTYEAERTVSKQRVTNVVAEIIKGNPREASAFVRKVKPKMMTMSAEGKPVLTAPHGKDGVVVTVNVGGKKHYYEVVDKELAQTWGAFDHHTTSVLVKLLGPFKRSLRTGVTLLPDFAIANAIRDNAQASLQQSFPAKSAAASAATGAVVGAATSDDKTDGALRGAALGLGAGAMLPQVARTLDAMRSFIAKDADYMAWLREGGGGFSEFYAKPRDAQRMLTRLRHDSKAWNTVRLLNPMEFGRMVEEATRVGRFKAMRKGGASGAEAAHASRDVSLDFSTIGRDTKDVAGVTAFFNAKVQGWDKLVRLLRNPKTWAVGAATITAPTIALWDANKDNPEYWDRPQWERNLFWLIPRAEGGFYRIPKPFEVGYIFASLPERILDYQYEKDPETLGFALRDMLSTTVEGTMPIPTAFEPIIENEVNFDFFRNRPVVPPSLNRLPDEMQYDDRTSSVALGIGKATGLSPLKVDNTIRGYTGSAGTLALAATDRLARGAGIDDRPVSPLARAPLKGRFVTREGETSDAEQAIYRRSERAERAWAGARELADRGDTRALRDFVAQHGADLAARDDLKEYRDQLIELSKAERALLVAPGLSADERRRVVAFIGAKQRQIAQHARRRLANPAVASRSRAGSTP